MAAQRGCYTVSFTEQSFTTANADYDFFEITPADDTPIEIVAVSIDNKSEIGDAQAEMISYAIGRGNTTSGNGTSTTPRPLDPVDGAATFTAETVASTPASSGTFVPLVYGTFHVASGLDKLFPEIMRPKASQANTTLVVRLLTALADDATFSGTIWVREL